MGLARRRRPSGARAEALWRRAAGRTLVACSRRHTLSRSLRERRRDGGERARRVARRRRRRQRDGLRRRHDVTERRESPLAQVDRNRAAEAAAEP